MKKILAIVVALSLVLGLAGAALAMGPSGADPKTVGLVLTSFKVSDSLLAPTLMMNWSGSLAPTKTYGESQPIWFVASYTQNKDTDDTRDFTAYGPGAIRPGSNPPAARTVAGISSLTTTFTSKDNCVNYSFSKSYLNFVRVDGLEVLGGTVSTGLSRVGATNAKLEVEFRPYTVTAATPYTNVQPMNLDVANSDAAAQSYYLQIMAFTNYCNDAEGVAYAKMPVDKKGFGTAVPALPTSNLTQLSGLATTWINIYDSNNAIQYIVAKYTVDATAGNAMLTNLANIGAVAGDNIYMVYGADSKQIIGFVSGSTSYRGMVKMDSDAAPVLQPVQYNGSANGAYVFSNGNDMGKTAISAGDLNAVMSFFGFSFTNTYPVLDKHFEAFAGYWMTLEAKYNVAAAVITEVDPPIANVPKTGDVASSMGLIMVAIALAGLAAIGFVMSKRVHN